MSADPVFDAAMQLPEEARLHLAACLLESLPTEDTGPSLDDPAFVDELDRRFSDLEGAVSWNELRDEN